MSVRPAGAASLHENFLRPEPKGGSSRSFGLVMGAVFALVAFRPLLGAGAVRWWALAIAAVLLALALGRPAALDLPNRFWLRLGHLLSRIVNPVVLGILFYGVLTPMAVITRLIGRDPLRLGLDRGATTYWIDRAAVGGARVDMRKQF
jgi:hypothetical protein